jgi:hypothetical protein
LPHLHVGFVVASWVEMIPWPGDLCHEPMLLRPLAVEFYHWFYIAAQAGSSVFSVKMTTLFASCWIHPRHVLDPQFSPTPHPCMVYLKLLSTTRLQVIKM